VSVATLRRLSKAPNYIRRFGAFAGLRLLAGVERALPPKSAIIREFRVPGLPAPVHLRDSVGDHAIFWQCLVRRQYELDAFPQHASLDDEYRACLKAGKRPLVIDCGANIGLASVWFATRYPEAQIYAIEPDDDNVSVLKRNVAPFGERVVVLQGGIWNESTRLRITNPESGPTAFRVESVGLDGQGLRAYTIPEVCALAGNDSPLIVKVDIEGSQRELFASNTDWVARTGLVALELDDWLMPWAGTSRSFFACVSRLPFDYLMSGETMFCFRDTRAAAQGEGR